MDTYNKRTWLNKETSDLTGSVVAFDGRLIDYKGNDYQSTFLEIADCKNKIRLHITSDDTVTDFIDKLELLKSEIESFINRLKSKADD
jgi:hypothetical protein